MKILIVDDSPTIRLFIKRILEKKGYIVTEASSGEEALELFKIDSYDLITLDIEMPGSNGYETCKSIRKIEESKNQKSLTPILIITSNDSVKGRILGFESGTTDFITKPFSQEFLIETVQNIFIPKNLFSGINVLLVEDSVVTRAIIYKILVDQGCNVIEADNGKKALDIIKADPQNFDVILTDYFMPEMNGDELCIQIRTKLGLTNIPIIFITAAAEFDCLLNIFKVGGVDYIIKPFVKEELIARLVVHIKNLLLIRSNERQLLELKDRSKLKDNLLAACSHDLKAPLNGILGFSELLLMEQNLSEEQIEHLKIINSSGKFLLSVINDVLDTANIEFEQEFEVTKINLEQVLTNSINSLKVSAEGKDVTLQLNKTEKIHYNVLGNFNFLLRAFNNLISNAIKFTNKKGNVTINLGKLDDSHSFVKIEDNGIGIPQDKVETIFNKFTKSSRTGTSGEKGTGLGLSISKELIEKHGGTIHVKSEEGKGSTFTVLLPSLVAENKNG